MTVLYGGQFVFSMRLKTYFISIDKWTICWDGHQNDDGKRLGLNVDSRIGATASSHYTDITPSLGHET